VTGPECYSEAERLLTDADRYEAEGDPAAAAQRRLEALARAILALTASHAAAHHPESVGWDHAINQEQS